MKIENNVLKRVDPSDIIDGHFSVPEGIVKIDISAFEHLQSLETVDISDSIKTIDRYAFSTCTNLRRVSFGDNSELKRIGDAAFKGCESLESIVIPSPLYEIGHHAFKECLRLNNVVFQENSQICIIGGQAFQDCQELNSINLGQCNKLIALASNAFVNCSSLTRLEIPQQTCISSLHLVACPAEIVRANRSEKSSLADKIAKAETKASSKLANNESSRENVRSGSFWRSLKHEI